ncbi:MAG TPA: hypothetical protein VF618_06460 [Thermoanaerobaculia bacterium]
MSSDDRQTSVRRSQSVVADDTPAASPAASLDLVHAAPPALAEPEMLVKGLRQLQRRIPEFTQLTLQEKQSRARVANLDPAFIESGLHAAEAWPDSQHFMGRTAEELREEEAEIRRWDAVVVEFRAITDGIAAANLKRKHRLGTTILDIYYRLGSHLRRHSDPEDVPLRPYYENMKRAYQQSQRPRKRKKKEEPGGDR